MMTLWGESLNPANVLPEYPRPQMRRGSCTILNGLWDYAITGCCTGENTLYVRVRDDTDKSPLSRGKQKTKRGGIWYTPPERHLADRLGSDRVESYFAMRKVEIRRDETGVPRIHLNGRPYFMHGVLDQGYWPDGLYTAPSDEALILDIQSMKDMGFNLLLTAGNQRR